MLSGGLFCVCVAVPVISGPALNTGSCVGASGGGASLRAAGPLGPREGESEQERAREAESEGVDRERVMIRSSPARCAVEGHLEASGMRSEQVGARLVRALSRRIVI